MKIKEIKIIVIVEDNNNKITLEPQGSLYGLESAISYLEELKDKYVSFVDDEIIPF